MKVTYNKTANAVYVALNKNEILATEELDSDVIVDRDSDGLVVGVEFLNVKKFEVEQHED